MVITLVLFVTFCREPAKGERGKSKPGVARDVEDPPTYEFAERDTVLPGRPSQPPLIRLEPIDITTTSIHQANLTQSHTPSAIDVARPKSHYILKNAVPRRIVAAKQGLNRSGGNCRGGHGTLDDGGGGDGVIHEGGGDDGGACVEASGCDGGDTN